MGYFRSQMYVNTDSPDKYQYTVGPNDVDGQFVRTVDSGGKIGQYQAYLYNTPTIISSAAARYLYKNTGSFIDLPNYNSEVIANNAQNVQGTGFNFVNLIYNCNNFNANVYLNDVGNANNMIGNCNSFNSDIKINGLRASYMASNYENLVVRCQNFNANIYVNNHSFGHTSQISPYVLYHCPNFNGAFYISDANYLNINKDFVYRIGRESKLIVNNVEQIDINYYNARSYYDLFGSIEINSARVLNMNYTLPGEYASDNNSTKNIKIGNVNYCNCNLATYGGDPNINMDTLVLDSIQRLNLATGSYAPKYTINNFIINNVQYITNLNSPGGTNNVIATFATCYNVTLKNIQNITTGLSCLFNNKSYLSTEFERFNLCIDRVNRLASIFSIPYVNFDKYTTGFVIDCKNIKNLDGPLAIMNNLRIYTQGNHSTLHFECDNIEYNMSLWKSDHYYAQSNFVTGGMPYIYVNANNIYGHLFYGAFNISGGRIKSNVVVKVNGVVNSSYLIHINNVENSLFSNNTNILYEVSNYFVAPACSSNNSYYYRNDMNVTIKFNTQNEITLGKVLYNSNSILSIKLIADENANPTGINMSSLIYGNSAETHKFICDQTMYDLMNASKANNGAFISGRSITDWTDVPNGVYNSSFNIYIYNNA